MLGGLRIQNVNLYQFPNYITADLKQLQKSHMKFGLVFPETGETSLMNNEIMIKFQSWRLAVVLGSVLVGVSSQSVELPSEHHHFSHRLMKPLNIENIRWKA